MDDILQATYNFLVNNTHNIISSIIGAIILYLLTFTITVAKNYWQFRKYKDYFIGIYYIYHYSTKIDGEIICHKILIYRSILGKIRVLVRAPEFSYTGHVKFTKVNIYLHIKGLYHSEYGQLVFFYPLNKYINKLWGVACLVSVIEEPIALRVLLSKEPLTEEMVETEFKSKKYGLRNSILIERKDKYLYSDNMRGNNERKS